MRTAGGCGCGSGHARQGSDTWPKYSANDSSTPIQAKNDKPVPPPSANEPQRQQGEMSDPKHSGQPGARKHRCRTRRQRVRPALIQVAGRYGHQKHDEQRKQAEPARPRSSPAPAPGSAAGSARHAERCAALCRSPPRAARPVPGAPRRPVRRRFGPVPEPALSDRVSGGRGPVLAPCRFGLRQGGIGNHGGNCAHDFVTAHLFVTQFCGGRGGGLRAFRRPRWFPVLPPTRPVTRPVQAVRANPVRPSRSGCRLRHPASSSRHHPTYRRLPGQDPAMRPQATPLPAPLRSTPVRGLPRVRPQNSPTDSGAASASKSAAACASIVASTTGSASASRGDINDDDRRFPDDFRVRVRHRLWFRHCYRCRVGGIGQGNFVGPGSFEHPAQASDKAGFFCFRLRWRRRAIGFRSRNGCLSRGIAVFGRLVGIRRPLVGDVLRQILTVAGNHRRNDCVQLLAAWRCLLRDSCRMVTRRVGMIAVRAHGQ